MTSTEEQKAAVGKYAADLIEEGMVVGLGTGSTVRYLLEALGGRLASGELRNIVGVPTSEETRRRAESLGIPLSDLTSTPEIDLALDGADEFDPALDLIKGLGGALLREKIVVTASNRFIAMVDASKRVSRLATKAPLPVEIDPYSLGIQLPFLAGLGARPEVRARGGVPFRTDGGNLILDCHFEVGIEDAPALAAALNARPGIFEHGLFLGLAEAILIASPEGVEEMRRDGPTVKGIATHRAGLPR